MTLFDPAPAMALMRRHAEVSYPYLCEFGGAQISVDEGVFCPLLTRTSPVLLDAIDFRAGERVLDVFAGSGAFGIVAALRGGHVITIDKSAKAVECARRNAERNGVAETVEARCGDFSSLSRDTLGVASTERFDLVIANPPLLPGAPESFLEGALFDPELRATTTFIEALPSLLAPGGRAYLLTSDVFERFGLKVETLCAAWGMVADLADERDFGYESYRVHKITVER